MHCTNRGGGTYLPVYGVVILKVCVGSVVVSFLCHSGSSPRRLHWDTHCAAPHNLFAIRERQHLTASYLINSIVTCPIMEAFFHNNSHIFGVYMTIYGQYMAIYGHESLILHVCERDQGTSAGRVGRRSLARTCEKLWEHD